MTTCRKISHFPDRFGGGGVDPSGQPDRFIGVFFLNPSLIEKGETDYVKHKACSSRP